MPRTAGVQMIMLYNYSIRQKNEIYYITSSETCVCPKCKGPLIVRDSKRRQVIMASGEVHTFLLRRLKCKQCNSLHLEFPDFIVPHKHYARDVIDMALAGSLNSCPAENSTIYRWSKERLEKDI